MKETMISPLAYVDPSAKIGKNVTVHPFAYIDKNVEIGDDNVIMPYASLMSGTRMGMAIKCIRELLLLQFHRILLIQVKIH